MVYKWAPNVTPGAAWHAMSTSDHVRILTAAPTVSPRPAMNTILGNVKIMTRNIMIWCPCREFAKSWYAAATVKVEDRIKFKGTATSGLRIFLIVIVKLTSTNSISAKWKCSCVILVKIKAAFSKISKIHRAVSAELSCFSESIWFCSCTSWLISSVSNSFVNTE